MGDSHGETGRDGGDGGLSGDGRRKSRLCGRNLGHASDHTQGVGHGEVGGEAIRVLDGRRNGFATA